MLAAIASSSTVSALPADSDPPARQESAADLEAEALYNAGVERFEAGDFEGALRALEASLTKAQDANTRYAYAQTLNKMGRCPEAVREYERVIELVPEDSAPHDMVDAAIRHCADQMAQTLESARDEPTPPPVLVRIPEPKPVVFGNDPGVSWRTGGFVTMGVGSAVVILGATMAAVYRVRGREFHNNLRDARIQAEINGCSLSVATPECPEIESEIHVWRTNTNRANRLVAASAGAVVGLGAVLIVAGGLVYREGKLRTRQWANGLARTQVVPTGRGVAVVGRF